MLQKILTLLLFKKKKKRSDGDLLDVHSKQTKLFLPGN